MSPAGRWCLAVATAAVLVGAASKAEVPVVVFDVPLITECRDVTPQGFREAYKREIIEAVFKVSPQLVAGEEGDLKGLHYEISTEQQMPVVSYLPNAQVATDVVDGKIAIQNSSRHGEISFHYLILPNTGDGSLKGDLESSHAQFGLLAPKNLLLAAGTIERGCGVYYELRKSSQDTLQKQREFACLFDVPLAWRADFVTIRCNAKGSRRGLGALLDSDVACGSGHLCVGLYKRDDGEARAYADMLARKQQAYLGKLAEQAKSPRSSGLANSLNVLDRLLSGTKAKAKVSQTVAIGAAVQSHIDQGRLSALTKEMTKEIQPGGDLKSAMEFDAPSPEVPQGAQDALGELKAAKDELRKLNGRKN